MLGRGAGFLRGQEQMRISSIFERLRTLRKDIGNLGGGGEGEKIVEDRMLRDATDEGGGAKVLWS